MMNRSAGEDRFRQLTKVGSKYQTAASLSHSAVSASARRLPTKGDPLKLEQTPSGAAATETVMYLRQQELASKSRALFEEGKRHLLEKNYKEAVRAFSFAIKCNPTNKDAKYYRAICFLDSDNPKRCVQDLNELIEQDPGYNQTVYVVLSIAHRRENDL